MNPCKSTGNVPTLHERLHNSGHHQRCVQERVALHRPPPCIIFYMTAGAVEPADSVIMGHMLAAEATRYLHHYTAHVSWFGRGRAATHWLSTCYLSGVSISVHLCLDGASCQANWGHWLPRRRTSQWMPPGHPAKFPRSCSSFRGRAMRLNSIGPQVAS